MGSGSTSGGTLWSTEGCATVDELGRGYSEHESINLLRSDFQQNGVGQGNATFLAHEETLVTNKACMKAVMTMLQIVEPRTPEIITLPRPDRVLPETDLIESGTTNASCPAELPFPYGSDSAGIFCCSVKPTSKNCPSAVLCCLSPGTGKGCQGNTKCSDFHPTPGTTSWQSTSWHSDESGALVTHFENVSDTGGMSQYGDLELRLALPPSMASRQRVLAATLLSPYEEKERTVGMVRDGAAVRVTVPKPPAYGVVILKTTDEGAFQHSVTTTPGPEPASGEASGLSEGYSIPSVVSCDSSFSACAAACWAVMGASTSSCLARR